MREATVSIAASGKASPTADKHVMGDVSDARTTLFVSGFVLGKAHGPGTQHFLDGNHRDNGLMVVEGCPSPSSPTFLQDHPGDATPTCPRAQPEPCGPPSRSSLE